MTAEQTLTDLGFVEDAPLVDELEGEGMSRSGPYRVQGAWSAGPVQAWLEQNTSPDSHDDSEEEVAALLTHPKVLVMASPKGRVSLRASDTEAIASVYDALS